MSDTVRVKEGLWGDMGAGEMEIATAVVTALGTTVATDAWNGFKHALSKILARGDQGDVEQEETRLDRVHDKLVTARETGDDQRVARIDATWSERLIEFLEDYPEQADALQALAAAYGAERHAGGANQTVINRNIAMENSTILAPGIGDVNIGRWPGE